MPHWPHQPPVGKVTRGKRAARQRCTLPGYGRVIFIVGGLTGVMLALVPFDWVAHDTYFVVAHLHYVLIGGMVFPLLAGFYYWAPMLSRTPLSERLGRIAFWLIFVGMHLTFLVMHLTGLMGMPRRVYTYPQGEWTLPNQISTLGAFIIAAGVAVLIVDLVRNFRFDPENNAGNLYKAGTLEWLPSGLYSSRSIPVVNSLYPLWDDPNLAEDVKAGRYFLPNAATGERETMVTSALDADPQYLQRMPGPSWFHFAAAVFTAAFFLLLTVKLYWPASLCAGGAVASILRWAWANDLPAHREPVDIGAGVRVPAYGSGPRSHGWWAMAVLLTVVGAIFAMLIFSYVFLWSRRPELWPAPPAQGQLIVCAVLCVLAWAAARLARARYDASPTLSALLACACAGALIAAWAVNLFGWRGAGLKPELSSHDAVVAVFLAWDGVFVVIAALMALYCLARLAAGLLDRRQPATMQCVSLFLGYAALQMLVGVLLTRTFALAT